YKAHFWAPALMITNMNFCDGGKELQIKVFSDVKSYIVFDMKCISTGNNQNQYRNAVIHNSKAATGQLKCTVCKDLCMI
ncbi:MAG: hypothetical protein ABI113_15390, partial [Mucilaginibacter sp.]